MEFDWRGTDRSDIVNKYGWRKGKIPIVKEIFYSDRFKEHTGCTRYRRPVISRKWQVFEKIEEKVSTFLTTSIICTITKTFDFINKLLFSFFKLIYNTRYTMAWGRENKNSIDDKHVNHRSTLSFIATQFSRGQNLLLSFFLRRSHLL